MAQRRDHLLVCLNAADMFAVLGRSIGGTLER